MDELIYSYSYKDKYKKTYVISVVIYGFLLVLCSLLIGFSIYKLILKEYLFAALLPAIILFWFVFLYLILRLVNFNLKIYQKHIDFSTIFMKKHLIDIEIEKCTFKISYIFGRFGFMVLNIYEGNKLLLRVRNFYIDDEFKQKFKDKIIS